MGSSCQLSFWVWLISISFASLTTIHLYFIGDITLSWQLYCKLIFSCLDFSVSGRCRSNPRWVVLGHPTLSNGKTVLHTIHVRPHALSNHKICPVHVFYQYNNIVIVILAMECCFALTFILLS